MGRRTLFLLVVCLLAPAAFGQGPFVNWEDPQIHPLEITPDGNTLLVAHTADNRLAVYNIRSGIPVPVRSIPVGIDPVTVRARTSTEAWVVNHISDSVSIVDLTAGNVIATLDVAPSRVTVPYLTEPWYC